MIKAFQSLKKLADTHKIPSKLAEANFDKKNIPAICATYKKIYRQDETQDADNLLIESHLSEILEQSI